MWSEAQLSRELKRVGYLVQNKGKTDEELFPLARVNLMVKELKDFPLFTDPAEQEVAEDK
ncbi:hypothetical protein LCGC14_1583910, partial [marine sediment metagenome]